MSSSVRQSRRILIVAVALALLAAWACHPPTAGADAFGQLTAWGAPGTGSGQLFRPTELGVDPSDDSVYVADFAADARSYRLQKFDRTGRALASATIPRAEDLSGNRSVLMGIAVDAVSQRLYLLEFRNGADTVSGASAALRILVFSTQPSGGALVAPAGLPSGELPVPDPVASADALDRPRSLAVDPSTHDLLVLAYDRAGGLAVQRIAADGRALGRFVDTVSAPLTDGNGYGDFAGLAVAGDGTIYLSKTGGNGRVRTYSLASSFATVSAVAGVTVPAGERWKTSGAGVTEGTEQFAGGLGTQLVLSRDDRALYWSEQIEPASPTTPGNYIIRGYSLADQKTVTLFGGNQAGVADGHTSGLCEITYLGPTLGAAAAGGLYVLDHGNYDTSSPPPSFGAKVIQFGPGGSGCPIPTASFTINGRPDDSVTVTKGATVTFDASGSQLHNATPSELGWDLDGSGAYATVVSGSPADLTTTARYLQTGRLTIGLRMTVDGSSFGNPATVTKTLNVVAGTPTASFRASTATPAAGATVAFDASNSVDPTGSDTAGPTRRLRSYAWSFGDGTSQTTSTPTVDHAFANATAAAIARSVRLTVTSFDGRSAGVSQTITVGAGSTPPPPPPPARRTIITPPPVVPSPGSATLASAKLRGAGAELTIGCAATPGACSGTVTLTAVLPAARRGRGRGRARRAAARATAVGSASFSLAAGVRGTVVVRLSRAARAALARSRRLKLTVQIETRNAAGRTASTSKTATLVLPARRKARRGRR